MGIESNEETKWNYYFYSRFALSGITFSSHILVRAETLKFKKFSEAKKLLIMIVFFHLRVQDFIPVLKILDCFCLELEKHSQKYICQNFMISLTELQSSMKGENKHRNTGCHSKFRFCYFPFSTCHHLIFLSFSWKMFMKHKQIAAVNEARTTQRWMMEYLKKD